MKKKTDAKCLFSLQVEISFERDIAFQKIIYFPPLLKYKNNPEKDIAVFHVCQLFRLDKGFYRKILRFCRDTEVIAIFEIAFEASSAAK